VNEEKKPKKEKEGDIVKDDDTAYYFSHTQIHNYI
jgi:hypothetical protein